jgi:hypothetical protein
MFCVNGTFFYTHLGALLWAIKAYSTMDDICRDKVIAKMVILFN